ncbi:MAG: hypothetical protein ABSD31_14850 [Candidatus Binataceae bacterium]|jgi:hypothetical protein
MCSLSKVTSYQGIVKDYYLSSDGELTGIFLKSPYRFKREAFIAVRKHDKSVKSDKFWSRIPGDNLYIPRDKILNLNVWYPPEGVKLPSNATEAESAAAGKQLAIEGLQYTITVASTQTDNDLEEP